MGLAISIRAEEPLHHCNLNIPWIIPSSISSVKGWIKRGGRGLGAGVGGWGLQPATHIPLVP